MFKSIKCIEDKGNILLNGQLKKGNYGCMLPVEIGENYFIIKVIKGKLRLNHSSINPDGFTYSSPPKGKKKQYYTLFENNTYRLTFNISESFGYIDCVEIVNPSMLKEVEFSYEKYNPNVN